MQGQERQNVRLAAELLSESCGKALQRYLPQYHSQASFIISIDKAFDTLNSRKVWDVKDERCGMGLKLEKQEKALKFLVDELPKCKFSNCKRVLPCQKALILAGKAVPELYTYVRDKYGIDYMLTSRLNQDVLENFFSRVRRIGGNNHPDCNDIETRIKILLLGVDIPASLMKTTSVFVDEHEDDSYTTACNMGFEASECIIENQDHYETQEILEEIACNENLTCKESLAQQQDAMMHVAGYFAYRLKNSHPQFLENKKIENTWISDMDKGHLAYPSKELLDFVKDFEVVFILFHGKEIDEKCKVIGRFFEVLKCKYPHCDDVFLKLYSRTRTFIRLNYLKKQFKNKQVNYRSKQKKKKQYAASKVFQK